MAARIESTVISELAATELLSFTEREVIKSSYVDRWVCDSDIFKVIGRKWPQHRWCPLPVHPAASLVGGPVDEFPTNFFVFFYSGGILKIRRAKKIRKNKRTTD